MDKRLYLSMDVTIGAQRTSFSVLKRAAAAAQEAATAALITEGLDVQSIQNTVEWRYVWHEAESSTDYENAEGVEGSPDQAFATG